jgi:aryl-alcohol dehydrogenase-like predicted oxidoreductase
MQTRHLGNSDLEITPIGIGAWAMGGGDWAFSWGRQEDKESIAAIHAALDAGVNWIDTAAVYGLGHSEEVVGKAVAGRAHRPYVFTKCSLVWNDQREIGHSLKAASVRRELEASLRRLRVM